MTTTSEIRFVSSNKHKITEAKAILGADGFIVLGANVKIDELQTTDASKLVRDKLLKAFGIVGRPLFVEHTGLYLEHLNGFPGGLTQIFWDSLKAERFAELFGKLAPNQKAIARTIIAYSDGKRIYEFHGEIAGQIVASPRGPQDFQWDCVFQPEGFDKTFAELGDKKNEISMRRIALDHLAQHLKKPPAT